MKFPTISKTEQDEQIYLEEIKTKLNRAIDDTETAVEAHARDMSESQKYLWENKAGMDYIEKVSVRQSITQIALTGENAASRRKRLAKLINSSWEISRFAQQIRRNPDIELIERHGEKPLLWQFMNEAEEIEKISDLIEGFENSTLQSLGIICKTQSQADGLYEKPADRHPRLFILDPHSSVLAEGVIISSVHPNLKALSLQAV